MMFGWVLAGQKEQEHSTEMSVTHSLSPLSLGSVGMGEALPWAVQQSLSSVLVQCCGMWAASLGLALWPSPE